MEIDLTPSGGDAEREDAARSRGDFIPSGAQIGTSYAISNGACEVVWVGRWSRE
jgi:hypothetical protein